MNRKTIPAVSLVTVTSGTYESYKLQGNFRARYDVDADEALRRWLAEAGDHVPEWERLNSLLTWLVREGHVEALESIEWHLPRRIHEPDDCVRVVQRGRRA